MATFVRWGKEDIEPTLLEAGFKLVNIPGVGELVFERRVNHAKNMNIRIYSSISGNSVRGKGKDAARVVLMYNGKSIWKSKRVHRTQNFLVNLIKRCRNAYASVCTEACFQCGEPMILRCQKKDSSKKFWSCANYPECKFTANVK